jgi:hypothetical protein
MEYRWLASTFITGRKHAGTAGLASLAIGTLLLCSCLIVPQKIEHYSGVPLGEGVPAFLVPGKTAREEVRAALGFATWVSDGGARECYRAFYDSSGFAVLVQGGFTSEPFAIDVRRLVLYFYPNGILERYEYDNVHCYRTFATWDCKDSAAEKPSTKADNPGDALSCFP